MVGGYACPTLVAATAVAMPGLLTDGARASPVAVATPAVMVARIVGLLLEATAVADTTVIVVLMVGAFAVPVPVAIGTLTVCRIVGGYD